MVLSHNITLPWSSIVIVHEKSGFFASFFLNISKTVETILIKKYWAKPWHFSLQITEHRKNYIFRDNNCFFKMSVS